MQTLKKSRLAYYTTILVFITGLLSVLFKQTALLTLQACQWYLLAITLCVFFLKSPSNTKKISVQKQIHIYKTIFLLQLCSIVFFYSLMTALSFWQPSFTTTNGLPFQFSLATITLSSGLFPWTAVGLFAVALQHHNKTHGVISHPIDTCPSFCRRGRYTTALTKIINSSFQGSTSLTLSLFTITIILMTSMIYMHIIHQSIPSSNAIAGLMLLILSIVYFRKKQIKQIVFTNTNQTHAALRTIAISIVILCLIITGSTIIMPDSQMTHDKITLWLLRDGWEPYGQLFQHFGWVGIIGLLAPYLANHAKSLTSKQLLLQVLLMPLCLSLFPIVPETIQHTIINALSNTPLLFLLFINLGMLFLVLYIGLRSDNRVMLLDIAMPEPGRFKPRSLSQPIFIFMGMVLINLVLIMLQGILFLNILVISLNVIVFISILCISTNLVIEGIK
ncbi:MAG: hypothetical protein CL816_06785 [Coxiellaceae bacterium]|nr:hypothetical protein [Coxiellaceae bacterium]|tara:strand:- start:16469 stop:17809 length:1341 start_codon:yes stop_codon:yes gene_type:complete